MLSIVRSEAREVYAGFFYIYLIIKIKLFGTNIAKTGSQWKGFGEVMLYKHSHENVQSQLPPRARSARA